MFLDITVQVMGYIGLARQSLAECFDEHSIENARWCAYVGSCYD